MGEADIKLPANFIRRIIEEDNRSGKFQGRVATRFPPEPNGYLHIGHAKSICLNFSTAKEYPNGTCNLRFDDTNPGAEDEEFVEAIINDIKWLGFNWDDRLYHASDYFDQLYGFAQDLIKAGKAYVCDLSGDEIREYRGTLTEAGKNSPFRDRSAEENLDLLERMKAGEFAEGSRVLRAKIDMSSGNINMRDPVIYRIRRDHHQRTGNQWCIYPMYDYAHCISDALENITHSLCTLEFEDHRPLYDWFLDQLNLSSHPQQIEFARLALTYIVTSKRKLKELVEDRHVSGWDDPRLPTLQGLRRRGYSPRAIRNFCERMGVAKKETIIDYTILEDVLREDLDQSCPRAMVVLNPIKLTLIDYPDDKVEMREAKNHPKDDSFGTRSVPFSKNLFIDREDFQENPSNKFFRLAPGKEVRLRYAYVIKCEEVIKDEQGNILELRCSHDPATLGKKPEGRKVKGTIHWVSASHALAVESRLYDRLFTKEDPSTGEEDFKNSLNPNSIKIVQSYAEPSLGNVQPGNTFQFERTGYFCVDPDSNTEKLVFNRTVTLRDTWAKINK